MKLDGDFEAKFVSRTLQIMNQLDVSRKKLAEMLKWDISKVYRVLNPNSGKKTFEDIVSINRVLGYKTEVELVKPGSFRSVCHDLREVMIPRNATAKEILYCSSCMSWAFLEDVSEEKPTCCKQSVGVLDLIWFGTMSVA